MEKLKKEYRRNKLNLITSIVKKYLDDYKVNLDLKIERLVHLLYAYGFNPTMSCEGHIPPYKSVDTFRLFWPYVKITINNKVKFDLEKQDDIGRICVEAELDHNKMLNRLRTLIVEFNLTKHPFWAERLELDVIVTDGLSGTHNPFSVIESIEKNWVLSVLICDTGVQGILTTPQELLSDDLRKSFLGRTQAQIDLFTKFLEWNYIENGIEY
ncbi:MAG: hypothetical protein QG674_87 [Patescibacteria group bacterium]|nr:hypothetical protein [Patescibacteria group bacterium]